MFSSLRYTAMDTILCLMMNSIQWRLRNHVTTKASLEAYLDASRRLDRSQFFEVGPMEEMSLSQNAISWKSPSPSQHRENNRAHALFFPSTKKSSPQKTVIFLHALMSAGDHGYRKIAARLNAQGWNVLFPHLPFHYSRTPQGYRSGSLAVTADLVRNGETIRQTVKETRQLIHWSRAQGSEKITLLGTSYGAWVTALLLSVEPIESALLLQPIVNTGHATFRSPIALIIGQLLKRRGISEEHLVRHAHLTSPLHGRPLCDPKNIAIIGGTYDKISPPRYLQQLCTTWHGSSYHEVPQGHFGFLAMERALQLIEMP
ncbi:MAG: alpha/beta hydrolase [Verrucomicrobia bacterium]|nr:alpha/beta hydrolase [Verrucomicrobiota bacterium]